MKTIYNYFKKIQLCILAISCISSYQIYAQQAYVADDAVNSVFISGGYGALFGAAMGAAILPFMNGSPTQNIRIVAGGASIGFMVGSAYGFYNLANASRNSYFNYNNNTQDDDNGNYYYSMPPTMPTQGSNMKNNKPKTDPVAYKAPVVGALIMGDGKNLAMAFPYFWVSSDRQVSLLLAYVTF